MILEWLTTLCLTINMSTCCSYKREVLLYEYNLIDKAYENWVHWAISYEENYVNDSFVPKIYNKHFDRATFRTNTIIFLMAIRHLETGSYPFLGQGNNPYGLKKDYIEITKSLINIQPVGSNGSQESLLNPMDYERCKNSLEDSSLMLLGFLISQDFGALNNVDYEKLFYTYLYGSSTNIQIIGYDKYMKYREKWNRIDKTMKKIKKIIGT